MGIKASGQITIVDLLDGATGKGIASVTNWYAVSGDNVNAPIEQSKWSTTVPKLSVDEKYLWNYEVVVYTDGSETTTEKSVIGAYGDTGRGIASITEYYLASSKKEGITSSSTGWTSAIQTTDATNKYLWNYEHVIYTDGTDNKTDPIIIGNYSENGLKGDKGDKGDTGTSARTYWISSSVNTISRSIKKVLTPSTVTFSSYYREGTAASSEAYAGRFVIQESSNGSDWTTKYTSSANESSKIYTPTKTTKLVKCILYTAGGTTSSLDTVAVGIVDDIEGLEIGGKNLLLGTKTQDTTKGNYITGCTRTTEKFLGCDVFKTSTAWSSIGFSLARVIKDNNLKVGDVLTYSMYCKTDDTVSETYTLYTSPQNADGSGSAWIKDYVGLYTEWTRFVAKITITQLMMDMMETNVLRTRWEPHTATTSGTYHYFAAPKLEIGDMATSWTPAPEDVDGAINNAQSTADKVADDLKNLEIGGTNLVPNSVWIATADIGDTNQWGKIAKVIPVTTGETYTLSAEYNGQRLKGGDHGFAYVYAYTSEGTKVGSDYMSTNRATGIHTLTLTDSTIATFKVYLGPKNCVAGDVYKVQLEKGDKATSWSPAPEDTETAISDVQNNLDNMEVGGRNLLLNTKNFEGSNLYYTNSAINGEYNGLVVRSLDNSTATSGMKEMFQFQNNIHIDNYGDTYTLSFYAKGSGTNKLLTYFHGATGYLKVNNTINSLGQTTTNSDGYSRFTLTDEWKRYWVTYKFKDKADGVGDPSIERYILFRVEFGGIANVCGVKLEKGNKATAWSPAPEDAINNLELGARNLLTKSQSNMSAWTNLYPSRVTIEPSEGYTSKVTCTTLTGGYEVLYCTVSNLEIGKEYVLSFDYEVPQSYTYLTGYDFGVYVATSTPTNNPPTGVLSEFIIPNIVTPQSRGNLIFKTTKETVYIVLNCGEITDGQNGIYFNFGHWKLEKGNKSTDWTPAPEDVENDLSNRPTKTEVTNNITDAKNELNGNITSAEDRAVKASIEYTDDEIKDLGDAFSAEISGVRSEIGEEGNKIRDLETYASKFQVNSHQMSFDIGITKGANLIKNSVMKQYRLNESGAAKANFWIGLDSEDKTLKEGYISYIESKDDGYSRVNTDSGSYFSINASKAGTLGYIMSNRVDFKTKATNTFLSYKLKQSQALSSNTVFFIGLVFYNSLDNTSDKHGEDMGTVNSTNGIPQSWYVPVTEFKTADISNIFQEEIMIKQLPIISNENVVKEEALDVMEETTGTNADGTPIKRRYVTLTHTPDAKQPTVQVINYNGDIFYTTATNKKVILDESIKQSVIGVRYNKALMSFVSMASPTDAKIKSAIAAEPVTEIRIYYNSSTKKIWVFNPFTGNFEETSFIYNESTPVVDIDSVRVIMGVRSTTTGTMTGIIDVSDLKLEFDGLSPLWSQNANEVYSKQYLMDEQGFKITTDNNQMFIDEDEITAYQIQENGEPDVENPVFQIKKEETILRKTVVHNEFLIENTTKDETDAFVMKQELINGEWNFIFY